MQQDLSYRSNDLPNFYYALISIIKSVEEKVLGKVELDDGQEFENASIDQLTLWAAPVAELPGLHAI